MIGLAILLLKLLIGPFHPHKNYPYVYVVRQQQQSKNKKLWGSILRRGVHAPPPACPTADSARKDPRPAEQGMKMCKKSAFGISGIRMTCASYAYMVPGTHPIYQVYTAEHQLELP